MFQEQFLRRPMIIFGRYPMLLVFEYDNKKEFFENLGLFYNKKLALGLIPVAKINRISSGFIDMSDFEIINSLSEFNIVAKTKIKE